MQHPDIVSVHDSDRDVDVACLVMEFVQDEDLNKHHLDARHTYTPAQTLRIMADLLSALGYANQQNVVHQDIKPANFLVIAGGHIKLANFGVARTQDPGDATRTRGTIVGTLKYISPEQLEGKPIDARTDLFAAGVAPCCQPNPCGPCLQLQKLQKLQIRWSPNHLKPVKNNPPDKNRLHFLKLQQLFRRPKPLPWRLPTAPTQLVKGDFLLAFKTV